ncbi:mitochondrial cytochrome c oxidase subunit VIa [Lanmaoa asiatica]|nr:mitochondrial cytochrome c oxidase subunit VIa [Lanmaoa asiatica]
MSFVARSPSLRAVSRLVRPLATNGPTGSGYFAQLQALREHAAHTTDLWRKISFYVAFPATLVTCAWVYNIESEHAAHEGPLIEENSGTLPQPPPYPYLNRRVKPFPWGGNNTLFFNSTYNKDMDKADE